MDHDCAAPDIARRKAYLEAISLYCPAFWESLRDEVFVSAMSLWSRQNKTDADQEIYRLRDEWIARWEEQQQWRHEVWIAEAAADTVWLWRALVTHRGESLENRHPLPVTYSPGEAELSPLKPFVPDLEDAFFKPLQPLSPSEAATMKSVPFMERLLESAIERETANQFRSRLRSQFNEQLEVYIKTFERTLRLRDFYCAHEIHRDAAWTALFQFGKSPSEIKEWTSEQTDCRDSESRIANVVKEFANKAVIKLRPPKAGRATKGSSNAIHAENAKK